MFFVISSICYYIKSEDFMQKSRVLFLRKNQKTDIVLATGSRNQDVAWGPHGPCSLCESLVMPA